ncbi:hypothetical protein KSS87_022474 [Heliosperma pusillum]|nr:hypothetical protein KSS87_022474 [Heliosperma pusillum]
MTILHHLRRNTRRIFTAAVRQDTTLYTPTPITHITPAASESLYHVSVSVSDSPHLANSYHRPGQYLQLKVPSSDKPSFLAIASPPSLAASLGEFHFLVKSVPGSTAELLCELRKGDVVELTAAMGNVCHKLGVFLGCGCIMFGNLGRCNPIRSLIESGFSADKRSDVRLYYGARNLQRMAYQDRFKAWEASGVKIIPVLSQPDKGWTGETGYVQAAFCRSKNILSPTSTGVVLCGQKQMTEEITSILTEDGVSGDKILKNF